MLVLQRLRTLLLPIALLSIGAMVPTASVRAQVSPIDATFNSSDAGFGAGDGPTFTGSTSVNSTIVLPDGKILLTGTFSQYQGVPHQGIVRINADGTLDNGFTTPSVTSSVGSPLVQPDGKIIILGSFTGGIKRLNADGSADGTFVIGSGFSAGTAAALARQPDGKIVVVGNFTSYNGTVRNRIVRLTTTGAVDATFDPGTGANATINCVALNSDGTVLIGGLFTTYGGTARARVARLGSTGGLDASFAPGTGASSTVSALVVQPDGKVLIAGDFTTYNGSARNRVARLLANGDLDGSFDPASGANLSVYCVSLQADGKILIGGSFTAYNGAAVNRFARLNSDGSRDTGFGLASIGLFDLVYATTQLSDGRIMIGGSFIQVGNAARTGVALLQANGTLDASFNPGSGITGSSVSVVLRQPDGKFLVAGTFAGYNNDARRCIARVNADGSLDETFNPGFGPDLPILAMALDANGKVLIAGNFTDLNGTFRVRVARLNTDGSVDTSFDSFNSTSSGANNTVNAIAVTPAGKILIGGTFTTFQNVTRNRIAQLNSDGSLDTFYPAGGANSTVNAIMVLPTGKILVAGLFSTLGGSAVGRIARLNSTGTIDATFLSSTGANGNVTSIVRQPDDKILIGGSFTTYNGTARNRIARLNADGSLDTSFDPGTGASTTVNSIALHTDGRILVGGAFTTFNGAARNRITRLAVTGAQDLSFDPGTGFDGSVSSLVMQPDDMFIAGGAFTSYNGTGRNRLARITFVSNCVIGTPCNDGNACTVNDVRNSTCDCIGTLSIPTISVTNSGNACSGTLTATGASTYTWSPATYLSASIGASVVLAGASTNVTYTVVGTNANGCVANTQFSVGVPVSANPSSICASGGTSQLTAVGNDFTYGWSALDGGTLDSPTGNPVTATPTQTSIYQLTANGTGPNAGCTFTTITSIGVYPLPNSTMTLSANNACPGTAVTVGSGLAAGNFSYTTIPNAPLVAPPSAVTLVTGGAYVVTPTGQSSVLDDFYYGNVALPFAFNYFGNSYAAVNIGSNSVLTFGTPVASDLADYTFVSLPSAAEPGNLVAVAAHDMIYSTLSGQNGTMRYWTAGYAPNRVFVVEYANARMYNNTLLTTTQIHLFETIGIVEAHVTSSAATDTKVVGVQNATKTIGATALSTSAPITNQAWRFQPPSNYTTAWTINGSAGPSGTNVFSINQTPGAGSTTYSLSYTDQTTGCTNAPGSTTITYNQVSPLEVSITTINPVIPCPGGTVQLTAAATGGKTPYTYTWTDPGGSAVGAGTTFDANSAGQWTVSVLDNCGVTTSANVAVVLNPAPTGSTSGGGTVCYNQPLPSVTFSFTGNGPWSFTYSGPGGSTISGHATNTYTIPNAQAGTYALTALNNASCPATSLGASTTVLVNPASAPTAVVTNASCANAADGVIDLGVAGSGPFTYAWTSTVTCSSPAQCPASLGSCNGTTCTGSTEDLSGLPLGTYSLTVTDANTCTTGASFNILSASPDIDGDGTADCIDGCPNDASKTSPGTCGCGSPEPGAVCNDGNVCTTNDLIAVNCQCVGTPSLDTDNDGTCDVQDGCPNDPLKIAAGACGCSVLDTDSDVDGTADCNDGCPLDPLKVAAGQCGCGIADTDTDSDGTANCNDGCPADPLKTAAGQCGCGTADTDTDSDGIANCLDNCPTTPGVIGGACNDGNPATGNDLVNASCVCVGQTTDCAGVAGGSAFPGTACTLGTESGTWSAGCVCVVPRPDIAVQNVTATPTTIAPSQVVTVDWTVANVGIAPSIKSWTERIYVESSTGQNRTLLKQTSFSEAGTIAVSGSIPRSDVVTMPTVFVVGDQAVFVVELTPNAALVELANSTANNTGIQQTPFSVSKLLAIQLSAAQVMEGASITATVVRSGSITAVQVVTLSITQASRTSIPATVTILAGQSGRTFTISALENSVLEGPIGVTLTASASGFPSVDEAITLLDNESPALSITGLPTNTMEGNSVVLTIATTFAPVAPLQVFLTSNNQPRFPVPASVTIAPGALFTTTTVNLAPDNTPELDVNVTITAGAAGHTPATANTLLGDDDVPGLALILQTDTVSESGGPFATTATLHRLDGSNPIAFTGTVSASIGNTVLLPTAITLAAGENDKVFYIGTVDNSLVDGYRAVVISVAVQVASCGCSAPPTSAGFVSGTIVVADNDGPSISVSATPVTLAEGLANAGTLRVTRNTPTNVALDVALSTSNTNEATLPASVSIPIGATFLDVPITTINDGNPDGSQQVYVQASAPGFATGVNWILVTDINTPDLQVTNVSMPSTVLPAMTLFSYTLSITNSGFATAPAGVLVRAYLSQNSIVDNSDVLIAEQSIGSAIATGQTFVLNGSTSAPNLPGEYRLLFQVNPTASLTELLYTNNTSLPVMVTIIPDYTATAIVAPLYVLKNTPVPVIGTATRSSGQPAANEDVEVYVLTNGLRREIIAHTDASGNYATAFVPLAAEAGHYTVGASFPGIMATNTQDDFDILGVRINNGSIPQFLVLIDDTITGTLSVQNMSNASLTNLTIAPVTVPSGAVIHFDTIPLLTANATLNIGYTVTGSVLTIGNNFVVAQMKATAAQGDIQNTDLFYYCQAPAGHITADITSINTSVSQSNGEQLVEFHVVNNGAGASGSVHITLPQATWLSTVTPVTMPSIAPGDTALVVLRFLATADVPFNFPISSSIGVSALNGNAFSIPFTFEKVSETTGTVNVSVEDEFTYFAQNAPLVAGAHVVISNYYTSLVYADGTTPANGPFSVSNVPEGTHRITVTAAQHASYQGTVTVNPGGIADIRIFLTRQAITYSWSVVPTTIPDVYTVVLTTTFETNVPKPVVILDVPDSMPALVGSEVFAFNATLTNHGLVSARDVTLLMPTTDPEYEFITNYQPADLLALQSIQVPVLMRRRDTPLQEGLAGGPSVEGISQFLHMNEGDFDAYRDEELNCRDFAGVIYWYTCNLTSGQWEQGGELYSYSGRNCPPQLPNFGGSGGPGGTFEFPPCANCPVVEPGDGTPLNIPPVEITVEQNSCVDCILDIVDAVIGCVPTVDNPVLEEVMEDLAILSGAVRALVCAANVEDIDDEEQILDCIPDEMPEPVECIEGLKTAAKTCLLPEVGGGFGGGGGGGGGTEGRDFDTPNSVYDQLLTDMDSAIWAYEVREAWAVEYFGEMIHLDAWPTLSALLEPNVIARTPFSSGLQSSILFAMSAYDIPPSTIQDFFTRWNTSMQAWDEGVASPNATYPDIIDSTLAVAYSDSLHTAIAYAGERGYDSVWELLVGSMHALYHIIKPQSEEVCASVTVQLSQQVTMTREAFSGTLTIFNGHPTDALDSLTVNITIRNASGVPSNGLFQINTTSFTNLSDVSGTGAIPAEQEGTVNYLFIPTPEAAPLVPQQYSFGGSITYWDPFAQAMVTLTLAPVILTVNPSPDLYLHYFLERNILGDDALTSPAVEPSIPAELAVMVENHGNGSAVNLTISSAQPEIVDNESGLAVNFALIGSNFQGQPVNFGVTNINFGNIPALQTRIGQWYLTSSLLGKFISYDADVVHANSFGNPQLSLVSGVHLHELTHSIRAYGALEDGINDFLVNDLFDPLDVPDVIYFSQGDSTAEVFQATTGSFSSPVLPPTFTNTLTVSASEAGWNYIKLPDPGNGLYDLVSVTRGDGQVIPLNNAWLTFVTLPLAQVHVYENKFHFVDAFPSTAPVSYTVVWAPRDIDVPHIVSIDGAPQGVSTDAVQHLTVVFDKPIDPASFTFADLDLVFQGGPDIMSAAVSVTPIDAFSFDVDLSALTTGNGLYVFTAQAAGVTDVYGISGLAGLQVSWTQYLNVPAVVAFQGLPPGNTAPSFTTVDVLFNLPLDESTVTSERFRIEQNGTPLPGTITVTPLGTEDKLFRLSGLENIIITAGTYELVVDVPNILTATQIPGVQEQSIVLTLDNVGPLVVSFSATSQGGLDAQHNTFVDIAFNEGVTGFSIADVQLTRNGQPLTLNVAQLEPLTAEAWKSGAFGLLTYEDGDYVFTIDLSGIADSTGNTGTGTQQLTWTVDHTSSIQITDLAISPDLGFSSSDGLSSSQTFDVLFTLSAPAAQVTISQVVFGQEQVVHTAQNVGAGPVSIPVTFPAGGNTGVRVVATASNGGFTTADRSLFLDQVPLTAEWQLVNGQTLTAQPDTVELEFSDLLLDDSALLAAVQLLYNGLPISTSGLSIVPLSGSRYALLGLSQASDLPGTYQVRIDAATLNKYSSGKGGSNTASVSWTLQSNTPPTLAVQLFLGGPYDAGTELMGDQLRAASLIPTVEPYTALGYVHTGGGGGESVAHGVFAVTGPDAIVDWVVLELRSALTPTQVIRSYSLLLQRDGDLVRTDGVTAVPLTGIAGSYFVAVRHRNHLSAMTAAPVALQAVPASVDFTTNTLATYGTNACKTVGTKRVLWSGNTIRDNRLRYTGASNDRDPILVRVGGVVPTSAVYGVYAREDVNMDSNVKYAGAFNDRDPILENIGGTVPTQQRFEQLP